jgi:predicted nucleic acid-binding protein
MTTADHLVVDASTAVNALTDLGEIGERVRAALRGRSWIVPEQFRVEVFNGIRGLERGGKIDPVDAEEAVAHLAVMDLQTVSSAPLLPRMWELRANITGYDAAYVVVAERLDIPLLTTDRRLAAATGPRCRILTP